jgi:hypothetical protein
LQGSLKSAVGLYCYWLCAGQSRGSILSPGTVENFFFPMSLIKAIWKNLQIQWRQGLFLCVGEEGGMLGRLGREANNLPETIAKAKKAWIYASTSPYVFVSLAEGKFCPSKLL